MDWHKDEFCSIIILDKLKPFQQLDKSMLERLEMAVGQVETSVEAVGQVETSVEGVEAQRMFSPL